MALDPNHPQYGEMVQKLGAEGGFTYNPRKDKFETSGWAVSPYPQHESIRPQAESTPERMAGYHEEHADLLGEKPHMMGGWRNEGSDYLDVSKLYPPTGGGQSAARYQSVKHNQLASMNLGTFEEDVNPFHSAGKAGPDTPITSLNEKFPEFAHLASSGNSMSQIMKKSPEMEAWINSPSRSERFHQARGAGSSAPPGAE